MDKEKRASDWPIEAGRIIGHSSDGEAQADVAIEVGLGPTASIYIGEVSSETLADYGVKVPFAGWWVCLRTATELRPLALTAQGADGGEAEDLARAISMAIRTALWRPSDLALANKAEKQDTPATLLRDLCERLCNGGPGWGDFEAMKYRAVALIARGM